jgi:hypothetical protein
MMEHVVWLERLFAAVADLGEEGRAVVKFLQSRGTRVGFMKVRPNVGAFWTVMGNIRLNSLYYSHATSLDDLKLKTLIIHEACHLQQGFFTALSVYGELEAWQLEYQVYHRVKGGYPHQGIQKLMELPLVYDRNVLKQAVFFMQEYAGKGYRADLLPLYPWGREVRYWLTRK